MLEVSVDIVDIQLFVVLESSVMSYAFFFGSSVDYYLRLLFWLSWSFVSSVVSCCWRCVFGVVIWWMGNRLLGASPVDGRSPSIRCFDMTESLWEGGEKREVGGGVGDGVWYISCSLFQIDNIW